MSAHGVAVDVEVALVEFLDSFADYIGTFTPIDLQQRVQRDEFVVRVGRVGGGDTKNATTDNPRVSVQVYGRREARVVHDKAAEIRAALMNLPAITEAGRLDSAETESGPVTFPWPDPDVAAVQMIFRLATRR